MIQLCCLLYLSLNLLHNVNSQRMLQPSVSLQWFGLCGFLARSNLDTNHGKGINDSVCESLCFKASSVLNFFLIRNSALFCFSSQLLCPKGPKDCFKLVLCINFLDRWYQVHELWERQNLGKSSQISGRDSGNLLFIFWALRDSPYSLVNGENNSMVTILAYTC